MTAAEDLTAFARPVRHEANNLFAVLSGTADILMRVAATERDKARAERLKEAAERLEALFKAYLALAAPPQAETGTDGAKLLELLRPLLVLLLGPGRPVEITVAPGLPRLAAQPEEVQTVILRLARDAASAVPRGGGLAVLLETATGGARLSIRPTPEGPAPAAVVLPGV